jgi:acetyl-CoA/propionyl-CoA carboxylase biotin carboxyl carrier protein
MVEVGQIIAVGDAVVVLEAMKMENQITAEKAGKVTKVNVTAGDKVGSGDVLAVIE